MTNRERFCKALDFHPVDRIPMVEWASWWDLTISRWENEGMPQGLSFSDIFSFFGLDDIRQFWIAQRRDSCPAPLSHGAPRFSIETDYESMRRHLFPDDAVSRLLPQLKRIKEQHERGDFPLWITLEGFFWFPRTLWGIEGHLLSFYDCPELYHRVCEDSVKFHLKVIEQFCEVLTPDFMSFAEDMSYNNGPMLSREHFDIFIKPYYQQVIPALKAKGIRVFVDTDGNVMPMIPWLREAGVEGILPLERQAGVDISLIRKMYPDFMMIGGFDKTCMDKGTDSVRAEFERLSPAMRSGGYIASVDHQTPPAVSVADYRKYVTLFNEYALKYHK